MKVFPLVLGGLLLPVLCGMSQITVEIVPAQEQFLRDESLPVTVRIMNRSGQSVKFAKDSGWLLFTVESLDGHIVKCFSEVPVPGELTLKTGMEAEQKFDLMPHYDFSTPGRYNLSVVLRVKEWGQDFASKAQHVDIVRGSKLWEQEFGVTSAQGPPEVRKYMLQQASYQKRLMLYVRVTDQNDLRVFHVQPIGALVSFSRPETLIDNENRLHVLFQSGARSFVYGVVNPEGRLVVRQLHEYTTTRPALKPGQDGKIMVSGGIRKESREDLPPPEKSANAS